MADKRIEIDIAKAVEQLNENPALASVMVQLCGGTIGEQLVAAEEECVRLRTELAEAQRVVVAMREALADCASNYVVGDQTGIKWEQLAREFYRRMKVADDALALAPDSLAGMVLVKREAVDGLVKAEDAGDIYQVLSAYRAVRRAMLSDGSSDG